MKKIIILAFCIAFVLSTALTANATVIDFESIAIGDYNVIDFGGR